MPASKQTLKILLAQGKLEQALDSLVGLTEHSDDTDLRQRVLTLSCQFAALKKQHLTGLLEDKDYRLQWNRIAAAVAKIADDQQLSESWKLSESSRHWRKRDAVLAVLASIAAVTSYTLRDFFFKKTEPAPLVLPANESPKKRHARFRHAAAGQIRRQKQRPHRSERQSQSWQHHHRRLE